MPVTKASQAKPMTIWCLLALALVGIAVAVGVVLFFMPGHGEPLQKTSVPAVATP
jgi:hypothetical protein